MASHVATRSVAALLDTIREDADRVDAAAAFRELVNRRKAADETLTIAVRAMRARQASWSEIAGTLGVTKQAAQQRYGKAECTCSIDYAGTPDEQRTLNRSCPVHGNPATKIRP